MARPNVFSTDTRLWHPGEGWRLFPQGETDPGMAWSEKEGGNPIGVAATAGALKDLIDANDRLDQMGMTLAAKDHDMAVVAAERDEANGKVHDLEQRAIAAETAQAADAEVARGYMTERDAARAEAQGLRSALEAAQAEAEKVPGLVEQLNAANQAVADANTRAETAEKALADANTEVEALRAQIKPLDGDEDGKVGGSKAKKAAAAPPPAADPA